MQNFLLAFAGILMAGAGCAAASPLRRLDPNSPDVVQAQYGGECANWHRQCARLYGGGTQQWNECMHQPQACTIAVEGVVTSKADTEEGITSTRAICAETGTVSAHACMVIGLLLTTIA